MIAFLELHFHETDADSLADSLEIRNGSEGSCLSHSHRNQYRFVCQTLILWKRIMKEMLTIWQRAETDLLGER